MLLKTSYSCIEGLFCAVRTNWAGSIRGAFLFIFFRQLVQVFGFYHNTAAGDLAEQVIADSFLVGNHPQPAGNHVQLFLAELSELSVNLFDSLLQFLKLFR